MTIETNLDIDRILAPKRIDFVVTPGFIVMIAFLVFVLLGGVIAFLVLSKKSKPELRTEKVFVSHKDNEGFTGRNKNMWGLPQNEKYYIWFKRTNGTDFMLRVAGYTYETTKVGDEGIVKYQGKHFINFIPEKQE